MTVTRTYPQWVQFFLEEGEEHVRARQEYGDFIDSPYDVALTYAGFCAFDAIHKGAEYQRLDFDRARQLAAHMTHHDEKAERIAERRAVLKREAA